MTPPEGDRSPPSALRTGGKAAVEHAWDKYIAIPLRDVLAAGASGTLASAGATYGTLQMPPGMADLLLAVGPAVIFAAAGGAGLVVARLLGRRLRKRGSVLTILGGSAVVSSIAVGAAAAAGPGGAGPAWAALAPTIGAAAAFASLAVVVLGTHPATPRAAPQVPGPATTAVATMAPEAAVREAYALMDEPTRDTDRFIQQVDETARNLESVARAPGPMATDARRVLGQLRVRAGTELLDRAQRALTAAVGALKAQRGNAHQAALRAEETARAALAITDPDRDPGMVTRGNQLLLAARLIRSRRDEADMLEKELEHLREEGEGLRANASEEGLSPVRAQQVDGLLMRLGAFLALAEATGRGDLVREARFLIDTTRAHLHTTDAGLDPRRSPGIPLEQLVLQVPGVKKVLRELGGGGFGRTFLAVDNLDRRIVVKTLRDEWLHSSSLRQAMKVESSVEGRFQHEGVPRVLQYSEVAGRPFKVMEFVPGGSLRDQMHGWKHTQAWPTPAKLVRLLVEVTEVLVVLQQQSRGTVHRDLKPENILLDEKGRAKLTDFGLVHLPRLHQREDQANNRGAPMGTLFYMSPEQARGEALVTPASDVYSLGVILHELLTGGQHPYAFTASTTRTAMRDTIRRGDLAIAVDRLPPQALDLVRSCLAAEPEQRPSISDLAARLQDLERQLRAAQFQPSWTSLHLSSTVYESLVERERAAPVPNADEPVVL
jgi:tRNA A-37 threonylcarbamoyl transferase component Bud32